MEKLRSPVLADTRIGQVDAPVVEPNGATLVGLHGDIDLGVVEQLRDSVMSGVERGAVVLVDLTDVTLIDAASLGALVQADQRAARRGRRVCLVAPSAMVRRTLICAGLDCAFPMFPNHDQAFRDLPLRLLVPA